VTENAGQEKRGLRVIKGQEIQKRDGPNVEAGKCRTGKCETGKCRMG